MPKGTEGGAPARSLHHSRHQGFHSKCLAAIHAPSRHRITELRTRWSQRGFELGAGIGIATGYATLGVIGFEGRTDYAAIGSVVNLAARLCGEAQHGQILVSGRALQLIEGFVRTEAVGNLALKGFHRPAAAYNVIGLSG